MARGPSLTQNEKYIMEGMHRDGKNFEEIAEATGKAKETIKRHFQRLNPPAKKVNEELVEKKEEPKQEFEVETPEVEKQENPVKKKTTGVKPPKVKKFPISKMMHGRNAQGEPKKGITVMTAAAGERIDVAKGRAMPRLADGAIFKIREGEVQE